MNSPQKILVSLCPLLVGLFPLVGFGQNAPSSQPASAPTSNPQNNPFPYGNSQFPHGNSNTNSNPYNTNTNANPYGGNSNPYGGNTNPYGSTKTTTGANPYGASTANPYGSGAKAATPTFNNNPSNTPNPATTVDTPNKASAAPKLLFAGAGVFGVGGLVAAGLAVNFKSKAKDATELPAGQEPTPAQAAQAQDLIKSTKTMAIVADSSLALAIGCAAGGFFLGKSASVQANISSTGASVALTLFR